MTAVTTSTSAPAPAPAASSPIAPLTRRERRDVWGMGAFIAFLHVFGWGTLIWIVVPAHYHLGKAGVFSVGLGITAYTLGMRHAFDADHIAAIDNTTRKLMAERKRPLSVGFWFSLGHSSVVFGLCVLLALGMKALVGQVENDASTLQNVTGMIGTLVSGVFLLLIGVINLVILRGIARVFRQMRHGEHDEAELERQLSNRGLINRVLKGVNKAVRKPWHMYLVGLLFGLGFDTATEVSLLVLAGGVAVFNLPWYAILTLPVLFAAGMSLLDTVDGCFMNFAYGWAFAKPVRKVYYNLVITGLSVAVALVIGVIELAGLLADKLGVDHGPLAVVAGLDLNVVGYAIVGLFVVAWAVALAVWRYGRIEEKWAYSDPRSTGP
jgi:high-affinity nickel-transport protein